MHKSRIGQYYENFKFGRVFIAKGDKCVTIKGYKTWEGKHYQLDSWISLSIKSGKPIIYQFIPKSGIKNITYRRKLAEELNHLAKFAFSSKKDKLKINRLKKKFVTFCHQLLGTSQELESIHAKCLRAWMPILNHYENDHLWQLLPILKQALIRQGFKQDSFKEATEVWFGRSPKGLLRRIAKILEQKKVSQLILGLSCREWNLDNLYALLDLDIKWDIDLDIRKAGFFLGAYSEKRWLKLLQPYRGSSLCTYELYDAIEMFDELRQMNYSLPHRPRSINEIHYALVKELSRRKALELKEVKLHQKLSSLDGIEVGGFRLVIPKTGNDLINWGQQLNNCLISYVKQVFNGEYSVIGVLEKDKIRYALGIRARYIEQFYGINNSLPVLEHDRLIREILESYGIN